MDNRLEAALNAAAQVDGTVMPGSAVGDISVPPSSPDAPSPGYFGREATLARALAALRAGSATDVQDGLIDMFGAEVLESVLVGNAAALDVVSEDIHRAQQAADHPRVKVGAGTPAGAVEIARAETSGALRALSWVARLAAEQLAGPALIDTETHAGRMLQAIAAQPGISNTQLAQDLNLDKTEVSRTGRRIQQAGLAVSARSGKANAWRVTPKGEAAVRSAQQSAPTDETTQRPLIDDALEALGSNGWEVVTDGSADAEDVVLSTFDDGDTFYGIRIGDLAQQVKRTAAQRKDKLFSELMERVIGLRATGKPAWQPVVIRHHRRPTKQSKAAISFALKGDRYMIQVDPLMAESEVDLRLEELADARDQLLAIRNARSAVAAKTYRKQ